MAGIKKMKGEIAAFRLEASSLRAQAAHLQGRADALERHARAYEMLINTERRSARMARELRDRMGFLELQAAEQGLELHRHTFIFKRHSSEYKAAMKTFLAESKNGLSQLATMSTGHREEISIVSTSLAELIRLMMLIQ